MGVLPRFLARGAWSFLLLAPPLFSAPLRLEDAEKLAMERNLERIVREIELRQARAGETSAGLRQNPSIEIDGITASPQNRALGASLTIPIDLSGRRSYRIRLAGETTRSLQMEYQNTIRLLLRDVRLSYYDLLEAAAKERIAGESESTYSHLAELNQTRLREQQISGTEAARSLIAWKQARLRHDEARLAVVRAKEGLRILTGAHEIDATDPLRIAETEEPKPLDEVVKAVDRRPDLLALKRKGEAARADLDLQKARAYPDFSLGFSARYGGNSYVPGSPVGYPFTPYHNDEIGAFIQMSLPVFDRNQGEISRAELEGQKAAAILERTRERVIAEIHTVYREYENAKHALQEFGEEGEESILARAGRSVESARFAYRNGGISLLEYLDAVSSYAEIRSGYYSAVVRYNKSMVAIKAAAAVYAEESE